MTLNLKAVGQSKDLFTNQRTIEGISNNKMVVIKIMLTN
jgi:hypothetical protein